MLRTTLIATTATLGLAGTAALAEQHTGDMGTIVETAQGSEDFSTLVTAIESAGLGETLSGDGPFTVFAPTNDAFEALPEGTMDELTMEENSEQLSSILTYHVVPSAAMAGDLSDGQELETVNGETLTVSIDGDTVMIGDATVTEADIEASNGVIHAIDTVMMPSGDM